MQKFKNKTLLCITLVLLLTAVLGTAPLVTAHGSLHGMLIYTANVPSVSTSELMFSIELGNDPDNGRTLIAGDNSISTAYPRLTNNGLAILAQVFLDSSNPEFIDQNTTTPVVGVLATDGTGLTPLTTVAEGAAFGASFSPDERQIVFAYANADTDNDGAITIHDTAHLAVKELGQLDPLNPAPGQLASSSRIRMLTRNEDFSVDKPAFLTDDLIVFTGIKPDASTTVYLYNVASSSLTPLAPVGAQSRNPAVSQDGNQIAMEVSTITENYDAVYDVESKTWSRLPVTGMPDNSFAWSVDGTLAIAISNGSMWQIQILDGTGLRTLVEIPQKISGLNFSPDGRVLAYLWDFDGPPGNVLAVATLDGGYDASVTSPDSDIIDYDWVPED
ncbi:MAG: hypothetical protein R3E39_15685 [Anaerolineae bacterium]